MLDRRCALGASFFLLCSWRSGLVLVLVVVLVDLVVRHANSEQRTANGGTREQGNKGTREQGNNELLLLSLCVFVCVSCVFCVLCVFVCCVSL